MDKLLSKYLNDSLTVAELQELRHKIEQTSDDELLRAISRTWDNYEDTVHHTSNREKQRILLKIHADLGLKQHSKSRKIWSMCRNVAAALLPVAIICAIALFPHENPSGSTTITTSAAEHATVTLPDGTVVDLDGNSKLEYEASSFGLKNRHVEFEGIAYFNVSKDTGKPFEVQSQGLLVTVMGTEFNLNARPVVENEAVLYLEEGSVKFTSTLNGATASVEPGQKVTMNYGSGDINVSEPGANENILAWRTRKLHFTDENLETVLATIEKYYNRKIEVEGAPINDQLFTGTIPTDNLQLAMDVIEKIFNVDLRIDE